MGGSHIVGEKDGKFWQGGVDSGRVAHINLLKKGIFWEGGVDSGSRRHFT